MYVGVLFGKFIIENELCFFFCFGNKNIYKFIFKCINVKVFVFVDF